MDVKKVYVLIKCKNSNHTLLGTKFFRERGEAQDVLWSHIKDGYNYVEKLNYHGYSFIIIYGLDDGRYPCDMKNFYYVEKLYLNEKS
jgi:hypothetical protein